MAPTSTHQQTYSERGMQQLDTNILMVLSRFQHATKVTRYPNLDLPWDWMNFNLRLQAVLPETKQVEHNFGAVLFI